MTGTDSASRTRRPNLGPLAGPENRGRLIAAAREVFAERGAAAPLSAIARRAGVGQGSLYRHFPDRIALAAAVFEENLGRLEQLAVAEDTTVDRLLAAVAGQAATSAALIDLIAAEPDDPRSLHLVTRLGELTETVVARERAAGRIRPEVEVQDVMLAASMVAQSVTRAPSGQGEAQAIRGRRMLAAWFEA